MAAVYYSLCKVRIQVRFEDFKPTPPIPSVPVGDGMEAFGLGNPADLPIAPYQAVGFDLVPYNCSIELNSYRQADTCRISLPFSHLPFDPRIIRGATVQVFGGTTTASEFAAAMGPIGGPGLVLPDTVPLGRANSGDSNEIFRGFADDWEVTLEGHDVLSISCRDSTAILIDAEVPENALKDIPPTLTLDQIIGLVLFGDGIPTSAASRRFGLPGARGIKIVNAAGEPTPIGLVKLAAGLPADDAGDRAPLPTLAEIRPPSYLRSDKLSAKGRKSSPGGAQKVTYWDLITDLCVSAGYIVYMRPGTKAVALPGGGAILPAAELVISTPRTYYGESAAVGERLVLPTRQRVFIYGQNVGSIRIRRQLGGVNRPDAILVKSWDPVLGKLNEGRFPPPFLPKNRAAASGVGDREEVKVFELDEVSGPLSVRLLEEAAKSIYEQLGRGELELAIRTKSLSGLVKNLDIGEEADLFQFRPGDPVKVEISPAQIEDGRVSAHTVFANKSAVERRDSMVAFGLSPTIAQLAATALDNPFIQSEFRCQRVMINWDHNAGWDFEVDAINYLDVRDAVAVIEGTVAPQPNVPV